MKLPACLLTAALAVATPAGAQSSSCSRDATGALTCSSRPIASVPNAARRLPSTRDLSAAALARGRAQAEAMRRAADEERRLSDERDGFRRQISCPSSPPSSSGSPPGSRAC